MIQEKFIGGLCFRKMRNMSEIMQANSSWSKTSGETDLGRNIWTQDNSGKKKVLNICVCFNKISTAKVHKQEKRFELTSDRVVVFTCCSTMGKNEG